MESYASSRWQRALAACASRSLPYLFTGAEDLGDASVIGAIIGETPGLDPGRPRRRDRQLQPVLLAAADVPLGDRTSSAPCSGSALFGLVALSERLVVRRAPEHVA
jgi:hypothetical protein